MGVQFHEVKLMQKQHELVQLVIHLMELFRKLGSACRRGFLDYNHKKYAILTKQLCCFEPSIAVRSVPLTAIHIQTCETEA